MRTNLSTQLTVIYWAILIITLVGCSLASNPEVVTPLVSPTSTNEFVMPSPISPTSTTTMEATDTIALTPTSTSLFTPTPTIITTPLLPENSNSTNPYICAVDPQIFSTAGTFDIRGYAHLSFQDEDTILFDGWTSRPAPQNAQENNEQITREPDPPNYIPSVRVLLQLGEINLSSGQIMSRTLDVALPKDGLMEIFGLSANEQWPIDLVNDRVDILSQSPDGQWLLVQIIDWSSDANGIWLLSQTDTLQLVPYVPPSSTWSWSDDSAILWYVHHTPEFGADSVIVQLEQPPIVSRSQRDPENFLDATYYRLAFSSRDNTVLSTGDPSELGIDSDQLFVVDVKNNDTVISSQIVPGAMNVVWNQGTQSYIVMVETDDGTNFVDLDGTLLVQVPEVIPPFTFALSPSGQRLAIGYGNAGIWVYECGE